MMSDSTSCSKFSAVKTTTSDAKVDTNTNINGKIEVSFKRFIL
jgi:hypothetical protein